MSSLMLLNFLKFVLLLLLADAVLSNDSTDFRWANNDVNNYIWSIVGEWRVVDCSVKNDNDDVDVKLWFKQRKQVRVDGERIKMVSRNKFNITDLQLNDAGKYYCKANDKTKTPLRINVKTGIPFAKPEITNKPNTSIEYGSTVTLECSLTGSYNDYEMLWFKVQSDGENLELQSTTQSSWSSDYNSKVQREILRISNFTKEKENYFCQVRRYAVKYIGRTNVELQLEELSKPVISNMPHDGKLIEKEKEDHVVNYRVSGTPSPDVSWYKSVNGKRELITKCFGKTNTCLPIKGKDIEVTFHSFSIINTSYLRHHNVTYICQATNVKGKDEKNFTMFVTTKPRLTALKSEIQLHKENLQLQCIPSKDANPKNISYSWAYCDHISPTSCQNTSDWQPLQSGKNNILTVLPDQEEGIRLYRCTAQNGINRDQLIWTIVRPTGQKIPRHVCHNIAAVNALQSDKEKADSGSIEPIVIWQGIVAFLAILLLVTLFLTFRRRNPPKQEYNACVVPVFKEKICDSV